jgi:hypothetical protein
MGETENVFIKLQIEKDYNSGDLMLVLNFDKNAPNFSTDTDTIRWAPTFEEMDLVMETYKITSKKKNRVERCDEEVKNIIPFPHSDDKTEVSSSDEFSERKNDTFEPLEENIDFKESPSESVLDKKDDDEEVFVQADDKTIDAALKRESVDVDDALLLDKGDKSIIDQVLKKRGKTEDKI